MQNKGTTYDAMETGREKMKKGKYMKRKKVNVNLHLCLTKRHAIKMFPLLN